MQENRNIAIAKKTNNSDQNVVGTQKVVILTSFSNHAKIARISCKNTYPPLAVGQINIDD